MNPIRLRFRSVIPAPASDIYAWHARPGAFRRLTPPWQGLETVDHRGSIEVGDWRLMRFHFGPVSVDWLALHRENEPVHMFADEQAHGPFSRWRHVHRFDPVDAEHTILTDELTLSLPFAPLSHLFAGRLTRAMLRSAFRYRHLRTRLDVTRHRAAGLDRPRRVLVLGEGAAAGQLGAFLGGGGHIAGPAVTSPDVVVDLRALDRGSCSGGASGRAVDTREVDDVAVSIRVTPARFAGDQRQHVVAAARQVDVRTGLVLTAVARPLRSWVRRARFGLPVTSGGGRFEWVALDDLLGAILAAIANDSVRGEVDLAAPQVLTPESLNAALRDVLLPSVLRTSRREEDGISGSDLRPSRLPGFRFAFPTLERFVRFETGRG